MGPDGCAGGEQFFEHDVALERATFLSTVALRPDHPNPAVRTELAAEARIEAHPRARPLHWSQRCELSAKKRAHLVAQRRGAGGHFGRDEVEILHGEPEVRRVPWQRQRMTRTRAINLSTPRTRWAIASRCSPASAETT